MAVMKVVHDPGVGYSVTLEPLDDRNLVFRLAKPAAMVVERHRATDFAGRLCERAELSRRSFDPALLLRTHGMVGAQVQNDPELRFDRVPLEQVKNDLRLTVQLPGAQKASSLMPRFLSASISASKLATCSARQS